MLDYGYWVLGTAIGATIGKLIHIDLTGLDFVLTSLFVVLLLEQWQRHDNRKPILLGLICTSLSLLILGSDQVIIPAMVLITFILLLGRNRTWFSQASKPLS